MTAVFFVHGMLFASWVAHIPHVKAQLRLGNGALGFALLGAPLGSVLAMMLAAHFLPASRQSAHGADQRSWGTARRAHSSVSAARSPGSSSLSWPGARSRERSTCP